MKLLTVGDSFTYGEELVDKNISWPHLLADKINYKLTNLGSPATGNTSMIRNVVTNANDFDLIIIAWSHFARIEIADSLGEFAIWPGCQSHHYNNNSPWRSEIVNYFTRHHNDRHLYRQYLNNIVLVQGFLKHNNKKYLMLDAFGNNLFRKKYSVKNQNLIDQIDTTCFVGWPDETMMEWTYEVPQGPRGHFLEQGHKIVADKIYEHIRNLSWIS
jgi:hypothetical protein